MRVCDSLLANAYTLTLSTSLQTRTLSAALYQLRWFAGAQIRNCASLGGNIATASPISDLNPVWVAAGASVTLQSA